MKRTVIGPYVVLLGLASFANGQEPPDSSKAEKLLNEYADLVVGGTWTGTVKTGEFVDGKWKPDGKEVVVNREHRWMSDKKFVHVVDKVGEEITNVGILGVDQDTGVFTGWHFGKDGQEDWWIKKETADVWLFGGAGANGEWMVVVRFAGKDEAHITPVEFVNGKRVPKTDSWPPEVYKRQSNAVADKVTTAKSQIWVLKTPLLIYRLDIGTFPSSKQGLRALNVVPPDLRDASKWMGPYIQDFDKYQNDPWGSPYVYEQLQRPQRCRITSAGPDGKVGTEDDIRIDVK